MAISEAICLGGTAYEHQLTAAELDIVNKVIDAIYIDYAGIDIIYDNGYLVFNEIEDAVGARMLYKLTDIDPVKFYIQHILSTL